MKKITKPNSGNQKKRPGIKGNREGDRKGTRVVEKKHKDGRSKSSNDPQKDANPLWEGGGVQKWSLLQAGKNCREREISRKKDQNQGGKRNSDSPKRERQEQHKKRGNGKGTLVPPL